MVKSQLKVRLSPAKYKRLETEGIANPPHILLTNSVFSTNRAILSLGGLKPNFIKDEKRKFKKPPLLKRFK